MMRVITTIATLDFLEILPGLLGANCLGFRDGNRVSTGKLIWSFGWKIGLDIRGISVQSRRRIWALGSNSTVDRVAPSVGLGFEF